MSDQFTPEWDSEHGAQQRVERLAVPRRRGFWDFAAEHPGTLAIIVFLICGSVAQILTKEPIIKVTIGTSEK